MELLNPLMPKLFLM